jgi:5-methylcytosine-specific restriction protein B
LSGSGKTKLAQAFATWLCASEDQYRIVPVGADWTNREPLLGFPNALNADEYVKPDSGVLQLLIQARHNPSLPHFLILDEMNLSHVERYFADFLSAMESGDEISLHGVVDGLGDVPAAIKMPKNLFIIGTVNIDETTNMFSPKVLDRANTIEFRVTESEMSGFLHDVKGVDLEVLKGKGASIASSFVATANNPVVLVDVEGINTSLLTFFGELKKVGAEFGYRTAFEIHKLIHHLGVLDPSMTPDEKIDVAIIQKLLPKLHGSRKKMCNSSSRTHCKAVAGQWRVAALLAAGGVLTSCLGQRWILRSLGLLKEKRFHALRSCRVRICTAIG